MSRAVVPEVAPGSSAFSVLKTLTHSFEDGVLYFLLQMKQGGTGEGRGGRHGAYLQGIWRKFEVGSWGTWAGRGSPGGAIIFLCHCSLSPAVTPGGSWGLLSPKSPESQQSIPAPWGSSSPQDVKWGEARG